MTGDTFIFSSFSWGGSGGCLGTSDCLGIEATMLSLAKTQAKADVHSEPFKGF